MGEDARSSFTAAAGLGEERGMPETPTPEPGMGCAIYKDRLLPLLRGELKLRMDDLDLAPLLSSAILRIEQLQALLDSHGHEQSALRKFGRHEAGCKRGQVIEPVPCPQCGERMNRVRNTSGYLNDDQFEAVKAGDWFCKRHEVETVYVWDSALPKHACTCGFDAALADRPQGRGQDERG